MPPSPYWTPSKSLTGLAFRAAGSCILRRGPRLRVRRAIGQNGVCRFTTCGQFDRKPLQDNGLKFPMARADTQSACLAAPRSAILSHFASVEMTERTGHLDPAASTSDLWYELCPASHYRPKAIRDRSGLLRGSLEPLESSGALHWSVACHLRSPWAASS